MFQLTKDEYEILTIVCLRLQIVTADDSEETDNFNLRSQFVTSRFVDNWGARRIHYAFTEQGVAMLSSAIIIADYRDFLFFIEIKCCNKPRSISQIAIILISWSKHTHLIATGMPLLPFAYRRPLSYQD